MIIMLFLISCQIHRMRNFALDQQDKNTKSDEDNAILLIWRLCLRQGGAI